MIPNDTDGRMLGLLEQVAGNAFLPFSLNETDTRLRSLRIAEAMARQLGILPYAPGDMATVTTTIGTTSRDYSTIVSWESDLDNGGVYSSGDDAVGECYNDSAFGNTSITNINGGGTVGLNSIALTAASGEEHDGTAGSGARMVLSSNNTIPIQSTGSIDIEVSWLEIDANGSGDDNYFMLNFDGPGTQVVQNNLIHDCSGSGEKAGIRFTQVSTEVRCTNNIVYDIVKSTGSGSANVYALFLDLSSPSGKTLTIANNTVHNSTNNGSGTGHCEGLHIDTDHADIDLKNNLITGTTGDNSGTRVDFDATISSTTTATNMSSDASSPDGASYQSVTTADQYESITGGSEDLHLKSGADAIDAGTDLGTTPNNVEIDINGRDRDSNADTWDIGAHEFVSAGGGATVPIFHRHYQTMRLS